MTYDTFISTYFFHVYISQTSRTTPYISYFDSQTRTSIEIRVSFAVYITEPARFLFQIEKAREVVFCATRRPSRGVKHDYHGASRRIWYQLTRSSRYRRIWRSYSRSALFSVWKSYATTSSAFDIILVKMFISYLPLRGIQLISFSFFPSSRTRPKFLDKSSRFSTNEIKEDH